MQSYLRDCDDKQLRTCVRRWARAIGWYAPGTYARASLEAALALALTEGARRHGPPAPGSWREVNVGEPGNVGAS